MRINTILFDLDGTLIDTNELIISSFLHTLQIYYPNKYKREDILSFMGESLIGVFSKVDEKNKNKLIETYREFNIENHDTYVKEFKSVYDTIKTLKSSGYKLGIVTTKYRKVAEMGIKLARLSKFFDVVVTLDDVDNAKPHPEPIEKALTLLSSKPNEAIMVGDNIHDIKGGQNAGVKTVAVLWSLKDKEFLQSLNPDYIIEEMSDLLNIIGEK